MKNQRFTLLRCRMRGIEAVAADTDRAFGRHTHAQFGIGLIERGAQKSASGRGTVEAGTGDLITVNPGEVHDGVPIGGGGRAWRMLYLEPEAVAGLSLDIAGDATAPSCEFTRPVVRDGRLPPVFRRLFQAVACSGSGQDGLAAEESLLGLLGGLLQPAPLAQRSMPGGIARVRDWMDDDPAAPLTLAAMAREAGLSRYQFLRSFSRWTGLTPHAYLLQRRIHRARRLIGSGMPLAEAAAASGFSDQSHMTRLFVRNFGLAPGTYAMASG